MSSHLERDMRFSAWYGVGVGTLIILQWIFFAATRAVPEFQTTPWAIGFHLIAELLLASSLMISGVATLRLKPWGEKVLLLALGMAIYSETNSPGYFAQLGQWTLVAMFAVLLLGAATAITMILKRKLT
jgi:hypothetical protein